MNELWQRNYQTLTPDTRSPVKPNVEFVAVLPQESSLGSVRQYLQWVTVSAVGHSVFNGSENLQWVGVCNGSLYLQWVTVSAMGQIICNGSQYLLWARETAMGRSVCNGSLYL